jgi:hypothetical protein
LLLLPNFLLSWSLTNLRLLLEKHRLERLPMLQSLQAKHVVAELPSLNSVHDFVLAC